MDKKVYIPNKSHHDFSDAQRFGKLVFLTEGRVNRNNVNHIFRTLSEQMKDSSPEDYILLSSLPILNIVAASIMAFKHGRINLLLWEYGKYIERNIIVGGQDALDQDRTA